MTYSKLTYAFSAIFAVLLILALIPLALYPGKKDIMIVMLMMLALVVSTISYLPGKFSQKNREQEFRLLYIASYLSHIIIIVVAFIVALWEYNSLGSIGWWFYIIIITLTLAQPLNLLMLKAFSKN